MVFEPHLSSKALAELCHRLAVEADAGIDIRRTWQREAEQARGRSQAAMAHIRDAVAGGEGLAAAMLATGRLFPPLMLEMVHVGEQTGALAQVFARLSEHYRRQYQRQRALLVAIAWPMLQLVAAIFVIGMVIWVLGIVARRNNGEPIDILGLGLIGDRGLLIYTNIIIAVGLIVAGLIFAVRRGMLWTRPLQRAVMLLPGFGRCVEKLALARLTWALHLTLNVAMDLRRVVPLVLRATGSDFYEQHTERAVALVAAGQPLYKALGQTGAFPREFIDALEVAEESGQMVEAMGRLSRRYEEEADAALKTLTVLMGFVVWALVAGLIIFMIFRLAAFYIGAIQGAMAP
jgi:type IV pilus assembly protein PilC